MKAYNAKSAYEQAAAKRQKGAPPDGTTAASSAEAQPPTALATVRTPCLNAPAPANCSRSCGDSELKMVDQIEQQNPTRSPN